MVLTGCSDQDAGPEATATTTTTMSSSTSIAGAEREAVELTRSEFADVRAEAPGCSIAVARDSDVVFAEAYGAAVVDPREPMTTETVLDIGSVSKQFTATAIALLAERGQVDVDAPISDYVAGLPDWGAQVTIRQLVQHTSGIPDYIDLLLAAGITLIEPATNDDVLDVLASEELQFPPGTEYSYSNSGYVLLAEVVRHITGNDLATFLRTEVFDPLGMAAVVDPSGELPGRASSYTASGHTRAGPTWVSEDSGWAVQGPGGVQTTPTELVRWASQYWKPTIGSSTINAMRLDDAYQWPTGERYGFGIGKAIVDVPDWHKDAQWNGTLLLGHDGRWEGFITSFLLAPEQRVAVAATCTSPVVVAGADLADITERVLFAFVSAGS